jgi:hypothetical protein
MNELPSPAAAFSQLPAGYSSPFNGNLKEEKPKKKAAPLTA